MGNCCRPFGLIRRYSSRLRQRKIVILLVGLDNAGKSCTAKSLSKEPVDDVTPTVGFNVVKLFHRGYTVIVYDLGGGSQIRAIWKRYFADVHGVIFVVDASDRDRLDECKKVFEELLISDCLAGKPVLLLANKQDKPGALDELDIVEKLNVERLVNMQQCPTLVETCAAAVPNENRKKRKLDPGIDNGYKWLLRRIISDYDVLNNRVQADVEAQRILFEKENAERKRRIEERKEKTVGDKPEDDDEEDDLNGPNLPGNPFQPIQVLVKEMEKNANQKKTMPQSSQSMDKKTEVIDLECHRNEITNEPGISAVDAVREQLRQKSAGQRKKRQLLKKNNRTAPSNEDDQINGNCSSPSDQKQQNALPPIRPRGSGLPWAHVANGKPQNSFAWELEKSLDIVQPVNTIRSQSGGSDADDVITGFR